MKQSALLRSVALISKVRSRGELDAALSTEIAALFGIAIALARPTDDDSSNNALPFDEGEISDAFQEAAATGQPAWAVNGVGTWAAAVPCGVMGSTYLLATGEAGVPEPAQTEEIEVVAHSVGMALRSIEDRDKAGDERTGALNRHRNLVSTIRAVGLDTAETSADLDDFKTHFEGRLDALSRGYTMLVSGGRVSMDVLVRDELLAESLSEGEIIRIEGPDIRLSSRHAQGLSFALHELIVNSIESGAALGDGSIRIVWSIEEEDDGETWLSFEWKEEAPGLAADFPSFSRRAILEAIPFQYGGKSELETASGSLTCEIRLPLPAESGRPAT